jgi:3-methyladenine DNA glycosylase AlkD
MPAILPHRRPTTNPRDDDAVTDLADDIVERVTRAFEGARDAEKAPAMEAYMRDQFAFLGIPSPARVALGRAAIEGTAKPTEADLIALSNTLWTMPEREYQYFAAWYLRRHQRVLTTDFMGTARRLITTTSWWDTIDELAQNVVGPLVQRERTLVATMDEWIEDDDLWLARTAILHQNRWRAATDAERLFRYSARRAPDKEFFIRKAIGWALREYTRVDPEAVRRFVAEHDAELSGLSKREALKWLERRRQ